VSHIYGLGGREKSEDYHVGDVVEGKEDTAA
jgi:hypothetical protein